MDFYSRSTTAADSQPQPLEHIHCSKHHVTVLHLNDHLSSTPLLGETVLHEHLWDRSPFVCPVRGRRVHEEQIVVSTRAVYPGSGRGGRVKPYSCLVCIQWESSGA